MEQNGLDEYKAVAGHLKAMEQKVDAIADKVDRLYRVVVGNGDARSMVTRLALLEAEKKVAQEKLTSQSEELAWLRAKVAELDGHRQRAVGFAIGAGLASGGLAAGIIKVLGG